MGLIMSAEPGEYAHLERRSESYVILSADETRNECAIYGGEFRVELPREVIAQLVHHFTTDEDAVAWLNLARYVAERAAAMERHQARLDAGVAWGDLP